MKYLIYYLLIINVFGFLIMWYDKSKAKKHKWRVPERRLFLVAGLFGSAGVFAGMLFFRHKTKHPAFIYGIPLILFVDIMILYKVFQYFK
jgi:uncharacterized membrane protein YsdA (DUF1294 family)